MSCVGCVYTDHIYVTELLFVCVHILFFLLSKTGNSGSRILYDMRSIMHLAMIILEETYLDIYHLRSGMELPDLNC